MPAPFHAEKSSIFNTILFKLHIYRIFQVTALMTIARLMKG